MSLRRSGNTRRAATWALLACCGLAPGRPVAAQAPKVAINPEARYNLVERFTTRDGDVPGYVGQYQVAFRETNTPQNKPGTTYTLTFQFTERPAAVGPDDRMVSEVIRHYDSFRIAPEVSKRKDGMKPLDDLTIWCREVPGQAPLVVSMKPNRPLQYVECNFAIVNHYVHRLTFILPDNHPVRVGETWTVSPGGTAALTNLELINEGNLTARLAEVRVHPKGVGLQAVIDVKGKVREAGESDKETAINARLLFAFTPPQAAAGADPAVIDGYGAIEKVNLSQVKTDLDPGKAQKPSDKRELLLERRFPGGDTPLSLPKTPPVATPENSWLTMTDNRERFHLRIPQRYRFSPKFRGPDLLTIEAPGEGDLVDMVVFDHRPLGNVRPDDEFQKLKRQWLDAGAKVSGGQSRKLPEAQWPGMVVYYMDAVLTQDEGEKTDLKRYFDMYVLQFPRNETVVVSGSTFTPKIDAFRKELEAMVKTLKPGPSKGP